MASEIKSDRRVKARMKPEADSPRPRVKAKPEAEPEARRAPAKKAPAKKTSKPAK